MGLTVKEYWEMMEEKRNGVRCGDAVIGTLIYDTEKVMDKWTLYTEPESVPPVSVDDVLSSLRKGE